MSSSLPLTSSRLIFNKLLEVTRTRDSLAGQSLHCHVIKTGLSSCTFLSNSLINFYCKCSLLSQATLLFSLIPTKDKDTVSWNTLINALSHLGPTSSLSLFAQMLSQQGPNICPNAHTFAGLFAAMSVLRNPTEPGRRAHCLSITFGVWDDVFVGSSVLNVYCKVGDLDNARKVFDRMSERNSVSWAAMVSGYAGQRKPVEAFGLFKSMMGRVEEAVANEFVLTGILSSLTLPELRWCGRQVHCLAVKNGLLSFVSVGNAIITMYTKCGASEDAVRTFELLGDKDSITWSAMVTGFAQSGESEKALKLFSKMYFSGLVPSEYTLVGVLNACSDLGAAGEGKQVHCYLVKLGFEYQLYIRTALVDMYAKSDCIFDARKGFDYLQEPDLVLWTSMIGGYVQNGENEDALSLYCKMQAEGILPNELTMASVLKACSSLAALEQGKQIHGRIIKYGFSLEIPIGSSLSTLYAKCGCLVDGNLIFRRMPVRDVVSWNSMISGLSQNGFGNEALELFEEMRLDGRDPDHVTFVNVLSACSHMGLVERALVYFKMMLNEFRLLPGLEHYACMVDVLSRAGRLLEAKELIESTSADHGLCLWRILLSACKNYRNYELGAYAGEKLMELGSQESSAFVLLSSIYTALNKKEDVERVRRLMSLRGVNKEPGCSWIELKNLVHVFVVGDQIHPQMHEIRLELQRLNKLIKDEYFQDDHSDIALTDFGSGVDEEIMLDEQAALC